MAEDLTEYLHEAGLRVRYMHSDVETLERIELIRDLRLGVYDVLVGINLLREGLDIPECGLVAILDADKEGFLRSETSLIQTIGRAARNVDGRVILYADRITGSMERALNETDRRRDKQVDYNTLHGITPASIKSQINDIMSDVSLRDGVLVDTGDDERPHLVGHNLRAYIGDLESRMRKAAADLEFEEAGRLRDEIRKLEEDELGLPVQERRAPRPRRQFDRRQARHAQGPLRPPEQDQVRALGLAQHALRLHRPRVEEQAERDEDDHERHDFAARAFHRRASAGRRGSGSRGRASRRPATRRTPSPPSGCASATGSRRRSAAPHAKPPAELRVERKGVDPRQHRLRDRRRASPPRNNPSLRMRVIR